MSGLMLTNYYQVYRSFLAYIGLAILVSGIMLYFGDDNMHRMAAMLIILFAAMPALEVIKIESKTGYDKYKLTLPISRINIVQSHYLFYLAVAIIGVLASSGFFYVYNLFSTSQADNIFNIISFGTFIVLVAGAIVYPLLYVFGSEKSDAIVIGGAMGGLLATFVLQGFVGFIIEKIPLESIDIDPTLYSSIIYIILGIIMYILSFFIATFIYQKKDF